jgi:mono/diheme cytochrome c family protein
MTKRVGLLAVVVAISGAGLFAACDEDISATKAPPTTDAGQDATVSGADSGADSTTPPADTGTDTGADSGDLVARGKYIIDALAGCGDCHTPRLADGGSDMTRYLSGVECLVGVHMTDAGAQDAGDAGDADAGDAGPPPPGCLNSRNLTNDPTGLQNRTDQQIRDMFQHGERPGGQHLVPVMPYWMYGNMTDADALAVVAYLRTVPGVNHAVPANEPPWDNVPAAAPTLNLSTVPTPADAGATQESALRGRYLATSVSGCIDCHTPETSPGSGQLNPAKWFQGSHVFPAAGFGLPVPPFPDLIFSANLTQDPTGTAAYSAQEIVNVLKQGQDRDGGHVCPPMPVGPHGPFGGMTDNDALDIANYVKTLPGVNSPRPDCNAP